MKICNRFNKLKNYSLECIKLLFQIFGYSLVGIVSILYGLTKQNIDVKNELFSSLYPNNQYIFNVGFVVLVQISLTLCFGYKFAKIYFYSEKQSENIDAFYKVAKFFIISLIAAFCIVYFFISIKRGSYFNLLLSLIISLFNIAPIIYCIAFYNGVFGQNKKHLKRQKKEYNKIESRYLLVIPSLLVIALNIFTGSTVYSLYKSLISKEYLKSILYVLPMIVFFLFFTVLQIKKKPIIKLYYIISSIFLLGCGITGLLLLNNENYVYISQICLNLFLAIMTSIFLSIFESWYIYFRIYNNSITSKNHHEHSCDSEVIENSSMQIINIVSQSKKSLIRTASWIISLLPVIVFLLFPFQIFNYIYIFSFCIGLTFVNVVWFTNILPNYDGVILENKLKKKGISRLRAWLGFFTMLFLFLDQNLLDWLDVKQILDNFFNGLFDNFSSSIGTIIDIIITSILFACLAASITHYDKLKEIFGKSLRIPIIIRLSSYIIACLIILILYSVNYKDNSVLSDANIIAKLNVSSILLVIFIMSDLIWGLYKYCQIQEAKEKE